MFLLLPPFFLLFEILHACLPSVSFVFPMCLVGGLHVCWFLRVGSYVLSRVCVGVVVFCAGLLRLVCFCCLCFAFRYSSGFVVVVAFAFLFAVFALFVPTVLSFCVCPVFFFLIGVCLVYYFVLCVSLLFGHVFRLVALPLLFFWPALALVCLFGLACVCHPGSAALTHVCFFGSGPAL